MSVLATAPAVTGVKFVLALSPVDFRKGHDGLAALAQEALKLDPFCGMVIVFRAKRGDRLKILYFDGTGLVLTYKRLEDGVFRWPRVRDGVLHISRGQFEALFEGLDFKKIHALEVARPRVAE